MVAAFEIIHEDIIVNRYQEPLTVEDIQEMTKADDDYAVKHPRRIYVVADFSQIRIFPPGLLTLGLRPNLNNPIRNPQIGTIIVICNSAFMTQLVNVVSRVIRKEKIMVAKNWDEANVELGKLSQSYAASNLSPSSIGDTPGRSA